MTQSSVTNPANVGTRLFAPLKIRELTLRNRVAMSPMCQYSSVDGAANDWHFVHLGSRAVGGAGLIMVEATAVSATGRITYGDNGIWDDTHVAPLARIVKYVKGAGAAVGIQLAHAGRKASTKVPWEGGAPLKPDERAWPVIGPSPIPFAESHPVPEALSEDGIRGVVAEFKAAALRAVAAGFDLVEIHAAHGYLIHSFLSPLSNKRVDKYGGAYENRIRLLLEVADAVRAAIPTAMPLFVRISATDWVEGGWDIEQSVALSRELTVHGVDLIDCSSGGNVPKVRIPVGPGYQVQFAERIRRDSGIKTAAVGLITEPEQAQGIIGDGRADLVMLGRVLLRSPYWPIHAAKVLGQEVAWPIQYGRGRD